MEVSVVGGSRELVEAGVAHPQRLGGLSRQGDTLRGATVAYHQPTLPDKNKQNSLLVLFPTKFITIIIKKTETNHDTTTSDSNEKLFLFYLCEWGWKLESLVKTVIRTYIL